MPPRNVKSYFEIAFIDYDFRLETQTFTGENKAVRKRGYTAL